MPPPTELNAVLLTQELPGWFAGRAQILPWIVDTARSKLVNYRETQSRFDRILAKLRYDAGLAS